MSITRVHSPAPSLDPVTADHAELRSTLGSFPSGIAALCAAVDGASVGLIATSFSVGVSYDPPLVLFSIQNSSQTWPRLRTAERLGISILGDGQDHICAQLASRTRDRFAGLETTRTEYNSLLLHGSALCLECEIRQEIPTGDHSIVVMEIMEMQAADDVAPLVYHRSTISRVTALSHRENRS